MGCVARQFIHLRIMRPAVLRTVSGALIMRGATNMGSLSFFFFVVVPFLSAMFDVIRAFLCFASIPC